MAAAHGHLTARDAGVLACDGGARRLLLQHYSQRHPYQEEFAVEARRAMVDPPAGSVRDGHEADVIAAVDLQTVSVPPRR